MTKEDQQYLEDMAFGALSKLEAVPLERIMQYLVDRGVQKDQILEKLEIAAIYLAYGAGGRV